MSRKKKDKPATTAVAEQPKKPTKPPEVVRLQLTARRQLGATTHEAGEFLGRVTLADGVLPRDLDKGLQGGVLRVIVGGK